MLDTIAFGEPVECSDVCSTIVSDDFFYGSPSAQDVLEDESVEGAGFLSAECTPFGPCGERAASLHNVSISCGGRYEHGIDVYFVEEGTWGGDGRRDPDFGCLADLTLVVRCDVLLDVEGDRGPPKAVEEGAQRQVVAFVSEVVVCFA